MPVVSGPQRADPVLPCFLVGMAKPLIAINCDAENAGGGPFPFLKQPYVEAVEEAGGIPLLVAPLATPDDVRAIVARVDGVLFSGCDDYDPADYGAARDPACGRIVPRRKADTDRALFAAACAAARPIFGICGGMQLVNIACGGTLVQDIPTRVPGALAHKGETEKPPAGALPTHTVEILPGTRLATLLCRARVTVNSSHHQAVERLGHGLAVSARAPDGVVEAVEAVDGRSILGVQWHPERTDRTDAARRALFSDFIDRARRAARGASP